MSTEVHAWQTPEAIAAVSRDPVPEQLAIDVAEKFFSDPKASIGNIHRDYCGYGLQRMAGDEPRVIYGPLGCDGYPPLPDDPESIVFTSKEALASWLGQQSDWTFSGLKDGVEKQDDFGVNNQRLSVAILRSFL